MKYRHVIQMPVRDYHGKISARRRIIFEIEAESPESAGAQAVEMIAALVGGYTDEHEWGESFSAGAHANATAANEAVYAEARRRVRNLDNKE